MNWKLINKQQRIQPQSGCYSDWKEKIASDCYNQCVYCSIHESQFGGINNFHIDHFRPKSLFPLLNNDIRNLYYSCPICNRFKSNDWPNEPNLETISYPDPSDIDYTEIFDINTDLQIHGKKVASKYIEIRLFLNRPQLVFERRESKYIQKSSELIEQIMEIMENLPDVYCASEAYKSLCIIQYEIFELMRKRNQIRPYELIDIRRND